ncbi:hypothetical protein [Sporosarcina sp. HYO08]|uniref:hypothetical protein n=1 Tax=Sporosarcina sp. HYO08 TaxID=1759557 RepID=UPI00079CCE85|nr:hypothetical protein [Sporosarcina sp. HYO08]KXH81819.1 hypothetical protein AU377_06025 [Sporosarcina sp. HYO08]
MYDPTIFDNLKVVFENEVYDLDNVDRKITITNRKDVMDFAILAREFAIQFTLEDQKDITAEIVLTASLNDLAGEILEQTEEGLGCSLVLRFIKSIQNVERCKEIEQALKGIWEDGINLTQTLGFNYGEEMESYSNHIELRFKRKINEAHMHEIDDFLKHVLLSLEVLHRIGIE